VVHEKTRAGKAIVSRVAPELDGVQVPDALAAVVGGRDETDWGAVVDAEAFTVEAIRQQHVGSQRVLQGRLCARPSCARRTTRVTPASGRTRGTTSCS
jgi:hypothetical protein